MTAPIKVPDDTIKEIVGYWDYMNSHERSQAVQETAREYNVSIGTVYKRIKACREYGIQTSRNRSDKGRPRVLDDNDMLESVKAVMGFKAHDPKKPDKRISNPNKVMSTARAIEILEKMRKIQEMYSQITIPRMNGDKEETHAILYRNSQ